MVLSLFAKSMVHSSQWEKEGATETSQEERLRRRVCLQIFLSKAFRARLSTRTVGAGGLESEGVHCKNRLLNAKLDINPFPMWESSELLRQPVRRMWQRLRPGSLFQTPESRYLTFSSGQLWGTGSETILNDNRIDALWAEQTDMGPACLGL